MENNNKLGQYLSPPKRRASVTKRFGSFIVYLLVSEGEFC